MEVLGNRSVSQNLNYTAGNVSTSVTGGNYILYTVAQWLDDYSTYILTAIALVFNSAAFLTIWSMKPVTSTSIYIATLAVVDTLCLVLKLLVTRLVKISSLPELFSCGFLLSFFFFVQYLSSFLIVTISMERFFAVWFPFRVSRVFTKRVACLSLLGLGLFTLPLSVWTYWIYERVSHPGWGFICMTKSQYRFTIFVIRRVHPLIYIVMPMVVVLFLNIAIIIGLHRSIGRLLVNGVDSGHHLRIGHRLTVMLVTTCCVFLVLELPMACLGLFKNFYGLESFVTDMFFVEVAQTLEDLNHAINFILYFLSGSKFRKWFLSMVSSGNCGQSNGNEHITLTLLSSPRHSKKRSGQNGVIPHSNHSSHETCRRCSV